MKYRFKSKDRCGNIHYLVVSDVAIYLTNPSQTPLAMSNCFLDSAALTFTLEDMMDSGASRRDVLAVVNRHAKGEVWEDF